jgi:hypothetical protein
MSNINEIPGLNGLNPLAYIGVNPYRPPQSFAFQRDPNSNDSKGYYLLALWLNTTNNDVWVLVSLAAGIATWVKLSSGLANIEELQGNTGGPVPPTAGGIINVVGDGTTITVAGNPGTNTLTISAIGSGLVDTLTSNTGGAVGPSAGNINVVGDGTTIIGVGNPGTHTITFTTGAEVATVYDADTGSAQPALGVLNVLANGGIDNCGSSVRFTGSVSTLLLNVTDGQANTIIGDGSGSATPGSENTSLGFETLSAMTGGSHCVGNTAIGYKAMNSYTASAGGVTGGNVAVGVTALQGLTTGGINTAIGFAVMPIATTGNENIAMGPSALALLTTGSNNIAIGPAAGTNGSGTGGITTGSNNLFLGDLTGSCAYTSSESNNILINNIGVNGESNVMRIGTSGSGTAQNNKTFVSGIRGVTTDAADAIAVLISSTGQLGTVSSSIRYKENVNDLGSDSEGIYDLRPVSFNYKNRSCTRREVGLIAEEVQQVYPSLVIHNDCGLPETVRYQELPILMLNEMHKLLQRIEDLEQRLEDLELEQH